MVPPRRIELPTPPLPIVYFLTIMDKNRQKLILLGNAKLRFTVKKMKTLLTLLLLIFVSPSSLLFANEFEGKMSKIEIKNLGILFSVILK